jgi:DNA invertase Pin-like site-specific DNA recombinase
MIAAIYARKSTEQTVADEQKSVSRQVDHARKYAARKGWTVDEASIFVDDGVSGAEFANRPGFVRLMASLKPRPPFQVLIMSEESRLGREAIETAYALKQLVTAGVRVFFYLEDRERTLDSPTDKIMMSLAAFADELERVKASQRASDKALQQAHAGHVTGGRVFGFDNVDVVDASGRRSHVERRINDAEAAIVRRVFELSAAGVGQARIAKQLNADGTAAPRSQQGRPAGWAASSVHEVLFRELYRGVIVWRRTRKRNQWGEKRVADRPQTDWLRVDAPELRIVPEALWQATHARIAQSRAHYQAATKGAPAGQRTSTLNTSCQGSPSAGAATAASMCGPRTTGRSGTAVARSPTPARRTSTADQMSAATRSASAWRRPTRPSSRRSGTSLPRTWWRTSSPESGNSSTWAARSTGRCGGFSNSCRRPSSRSPTDRRHRSWRRSTLARAPASGRRAAAPGTRWLNRGTQGDHPWTPD